MPKYYIVKWPESKKFMHNDECFWIMGGMSLAVPCELYDSKNK